MQPQTYRVIANDKEAGTLPRDQYEAIRAAVRRDWRVWAAQAIGHGYAALRMFLVLLLRTIWITPLIWFWLLVAVAVYDPSNFAATIVAVAKYPASAAGGFVLTVLICGVLAVLVGGLGPRWYARSAGAADVFQDAIDTRIRQVLNLPASAVVWVEHS